MSTLASESNERSGRKRERSLSMALESSETGDGTRTPSFFCQSSHKTAQFELAGLSASDDDPARAIGKLAHRGLSRNRYKEDEGEESMFETDDEGGQRKAPGKSKDDRKGHLDVLIGSIEQFLDQGEIEKASRAYGLALQLRPLSRPLDVRSHNLWAMGAEILMRQGEEERRETLGRSGQHRRRWGSAANMGSVRAYFETLVRQHPYDPKRPKKVCAVDYWLALLSCEVYNAHAEYVTAMMDERITGENDDDEQTDVLESGAGFEETDEAKAPRQSLRGQWRDATREMALDTMRDIIQRMEGLMEQPPYSKHEQFLRLRAAASFFAADLCVPTVNVLSSSEAETRRRLERRAAINAIRELANVRGDAILATDAVLDSFIVNGGRAKTATTSLYSSLPIRRG